MNLTKTMFKQIINYSSNKSRIIIEEIDGSRNPMEVAAAALLL
jgi:hypothetical protein